VASLWRSVANGIQAFDPKQNSVTVPAHLGSRAAGCLRVGVKDGSMLERVTGLAIAVVGAVGLTAGFMAVPAGAEGYPPAESGIAVGCTTPAPGETVTVTASGFTPGADVTVILDPGPASLGRGAADGEGAFTLDATIPDDTQPGNHTITAAGQSPDGLRSLTARVNVTAEGCEAAGAPTPAPAGGAPAPSSDDSGGGGGLAFTGSGLTMLLLQVALALAAVGGAFMALSKRRRSRATV
jgi:hypothetical protein